MHTLGHTSGYMSFANGWTLMKASMESQFSYYLLIWMFHSRIMNININRIHERDLKLVYSDELIYSDELWWITQEWILLNLRQEDPNVSYWNTPVFSWSFSKIMKNIFQVNTNNPYSVRSRNELYCRNPKTVKHGTEKYGYLAPKIGSLVPEIIKNTKTLDIFKNKMR